MRHDPASAGFRLLRYTLRMLYTGKGDSGTTTAFGCNQERISKSSEIPEALGALDELNATLGVVKAQVRSMHPWASDYRRIAELLHGAQETLFVIQAEVAGADKRVREGAVTKVEEVVNAIEKTIPPLTGFSIAGGTMLSAELDRARTVARRAERRVVAVEKAGLRTLSSETFRYLNRLSSLLFALARLANHLAGVPEENPKY